MAIEPTIVVTMGDPGGIGPEVTVRALDAVRRESAARFVVIGPEAVLRSAALSCGVPVFWGGGAAEAERVRVIPPPGGGPAGFAHAPNAWGGEVSFRAVEEAVRWAASGRASAIVTGPISKEAWSLAGHGAYPGHTELLAERFGAARHAMFFHAPASGPMRELNVVLATVHIPLSRVAAELTIGRVLDATRLGAEACERLGRNRPRVAVCGLNPHAGEGGLLGGDEGRMIVPAIEAARELGIDARGPVPGDTVFGRAMRGEFDLVVAMYHDQGLIPVKLLAWDRAVNCTLGLPVPRTSPDHGTAFDIAGRGVADAGSMASALRLAARWAGG